MARHRRYKRKPSRRHRVIRWLLAVGTLSLAILVVVIWLEYRRMGHAHVEINREVYPIVGIDISRNNGQVDFDDVRADGVSFVFIKSSEGGSFRDKTFRHNVSRAHEAGLKVGAYHFFRKSVDGKRQAQNFLHAVEDMPLDLPLAIDVEDWNNDKSVPDGLVVERLRSMVAHLHAKHQKVMVYTNVHGYRKWIEKYFPSLELWICSFTPPEHMIMDHRLQQYSHWGTVDGVRGEVDLNVFNGSRHDWEQWLIAMRQ